MELLARAEQLWMHVKIYASGGENAVHVHSDVAILAQLRRARMDAHAYPYRAG